MKTIILWLSVCLLGICQLLQAQPTTQPIPTKNLIVMIPDGTSLPVVSASRYYKMMLGQEPSLNIDPYLCGTVRTFCSNGPIGDSAPTTSCYMTGYPSQAGFVSTYPPADPTQDLVPIDPSKTYQPLATVLEAGRLLQNKATGLVTRCLFPHATPADCSAHYYKRGEYSVIASQMAHNNLDVVICGGTDYITPTIREHFQRTNTHYIENDLQALRNYKEDGKLWALFSPSDMPYQIDQDNATTPTLAEMTQTALDRLAKSENGFFLMVEGSEVDYAAHANDANTIINEFIAFDDAVGIALDFAKKDGNTTVVILPDHGNSGFSIGRSGCGSYNTALNVLMGAMKDYKCSAKQLASILNKTQPDELQSTFFNYTNIQLSPKELATLQQARDYQFRAEDAEKTHSLLTQTTQLMNQQTCIGFTSGTHTAEEVFLAAYHPQNTTPNGHRNNMEINTYLQQVFGLPQSLDELTAEIYVPHTTLLKDYTYSLDSTNPKFPVLKIGKGKKAVEVLAQTSYIRKAGKLIDLNSLCVYQEANQTFYLPKAILEQL